MANTETANTAPTPAGDFAKQKDPFALFQAWMSDAERHEINDPNAMALATADADGLPNIRMVLLKGLDEATDEPCVEAGVNVEGENGVVTGGTSGVGTNRGFVFYTNFESAKGCELLHSGKAGLLFHWKSLRRQVRIRGVVTLVSDAEADVYFDSRARGSRIGAWASQQSRPLESRYALEKSVAGYAAKFNISKISRPPHWSGFRVTPVEIEFWHDRPFRLHERVVFRRDSTADAWQTTKLYP